MECAPAVGTYRSVPPPPLPPQDRPLCSPLLCSHHGGRTAAPCAQGATRGRVSVGRRAARDDIPPTQPAEPEAEGGELRGRRKTGAGGCGLRRVRVFVLQRGGNWQRARQMLQRRHPKLCCAAGALAWVAGMPCRAGRPPVLYRGLLPRAVLRCAAVRRSLTRCAVLGQQHSDSAATHPGGDD